MKIASALFAVLGLSVSTIVTVWLVGSLVVWSVDVAGEVGQDILAQFSTPWIGGKHAPSRSIQQSEGRRLSPSPRRRTDVLTTKETS